MTWAELFWAFPLVLAISVVLGTAGDRRGDEIGPAIRRTFVLLTLALAAIGIVIRTVVTIWA
jgi:hypothetical protein